MYSFGERYEHHKNGDPEASEINNWNRLFDKAIIHDGFNPHVAARIYSYSNLAYYHLLCDSSERVNSFPGRLINMPKAVSSDDIHILCVRAGISFYLIAKQLIYTDEAFDNEFEILKR
jgi:hypothetical protein